MDVDLAAKEAHVAWQLWLDADTYVACSFVSLGPQLIRHAYSLDGLDSTQREIIANWADEYYQTAIHLGTAQILVIDPLGMTANEE